MSDENRYYENTENSEPAENFASDPQNKDAFIIESTSLIENPVIGYPADGSPECTALHCQRTGTAKQSPAATDTKIFAACVFAFCKMCKISCNPIVPVLPVVCKTQLVAQAKKI